MEELKGQKIKIRPFAHHDLEAYTHWQQPHHRWHDFNGPYYAKSTPEQIDKRVAKLREFIGTPQLTKNQWVIADLQNDAIMGTVSWYWSSEETNWLSVGISVFDDGQWSKGIGYEALGLWSQYLLDTMPQLVRLDLRTWSGNIGMMKLAEKLGYQEEARFRMARIVNGRYYDGMGYGILRTEWNGRYPDGFAASLAPKPRHHPTAD